MKIAFFIPSLRGGGSEKVFVLLANDFINRGIDVDMVLINKRGEYLDDLNQRINVINLNCTKLWTSVRSFINYLDVNSPSAVISSMPLANTIAVTSQHLSSFSGPVILTHHNSRDMLKGYVEKFSQKLFIPWVQLSYKFSDAIICVSKRVAETVNKIVKDRDRLDVIYNPIEVDSIIEKAKAPVDELDHSKTNIIAVGRLVD